MAKATKPSTKVYPVELQGWVEIVRLEFRTLEFIWNLGFGTWNLWQGLPCPYFNYSHFDIP